MILAALLPRFDAVVPVMSTGADRHLKYWSVYYRHHGREHHATVMPLPHQRKERP